MRAMLEERKRPESEWLEDEDFKNWININKGFYNLRKRLDELGYDINQLYPGTNVPFLTVRRKKIIASIKSICDNWYGNGEGIKRTELGIYADARATFAFDGKSYLVKVNEIGNLDTKGTDIMLVEKPEVLEKLAPLTKRVGIALLTCSGNYVEYAEELCNKAHDKGCNVFIVGDADIPALTMALRIPYAKHIALDLNTLRVLGINAIDVDEPYEPSENQYKFVEDKIRLYKSSVVNGGMSDLIASGDYTIGDGKNYDFSHKEYKDKMNIIHYNVPLLKKLADNHDFWEYVKHRRIELDIFIEDDNFDLQAFWKYLCDQMSSLYPTRDLNRAAHPPLTTIPDIIIDITMEMKRVGKNEGIKEANKIWHEQNVWNEGICEDVEKLKEDNTTRVKEAIEENEHIASACSMLKPILQMLKAVKVNDKYPNLETDKLDTTIWVPKKER